MPSKRGLSDKNKRRVSEILNRLQNIEEESDESKDERVKLERELKKLQAKCNHDYRATGDVETIGFFGVMVTYTCCTCHKRKI